MFQDVAIITKINNSSKMYSLIILLGISNYFTVNQDVALIRQQLGNNYCMSVPSDFEISKTEGMDFTVYHFNSNDTLEAEKISFGLYLGDYPSSYKSVCEECDIDFFEGELINKPCSWTIYRDDDRYFIETVIQKNESGTVNLGIVDGKESYLLVSQNKIHAFGKANKKEDLDLILKIFSTLTIEN